MMIHKGLESALQNDLRWFAANPNRQFRLRAATPGDALQHESIKDARWVIVPRPQDGLWTRYHGVANDAVPDGASFTDTDAEAWLLTHQHKRDVFAIADPVNMRLFHVGPDTADMANA